MSEIRPRSDIVQYIPKDNETEGIQPITYWEVTDVDISEYSKNIQIGRIVPSRVITAGTSAASARLLVIGPEDVIALETQNATFTVSATIRNNDSVIPTFQWQKKESATTIWTTISGAVAAQYTVPNLSFANDNNDMYRCIISSSISQNSPVTSREATLTVKRLIIITSQPNNTTVTTSQTATFSVSATITSGIINYQWQKRDFGSATFVDVVGATNSSYVTPPVDINTDNQDVYRCVLSNANADTVISAEATLTVQGADLRITPAVGGISFWRFATNGELILDPSNATTYEIQCLGDNKNVRVDMWGQGSCNAQGGYSNGFVPMNTNQIFTVRLNAGAGSGGTFSGSARINGGGYAGIFSSSTVSQANALLIAGGAGGGGSYSVGTCALTGGAGGGSSGGNGQQYIATIGGDGPFSPPNVNYNPSCGGPSYGWFTRSGGASSDPASAGNDIRQLVLMWNGSVIFNWNSGVSGALPNTLKRGYLVLGDYLYFAGSYVGSAYGWHSNGTTCGTASSPNGDFANSFAIRRQGVGANLSASGSTSGTLYLQDQNRGTNGSALQGGSGASSEDLYACGQPFYGGGGGGGGGYVGGGGGAAAGSAAGAGGGGSGFVAGTVTGTTSTYVSSVPGITKGTAGDVGQNSRVNINFGIITITSQPTVNASYISGQTATMSVSATITYGTISYQWQKRENGSVNWNNIAGATNTSYTTPSLDTANDNGDSYRCVLTSPSAATVTSNVVTINMLDFDLIITGSGSPVGNGGVEIGSNRYWSFAVHGNLAFAGSTLPGVTLTFYKNLSKQVKMWGMGRSAGALGGYSTGTVSFSSGQNYFAIFAGGGNGGTGRGNQGSEQGGQYAGLFRGTSASQGNAVMIAGGAGGAGLAYGAQAKGGDGGGSNGGSGANSPDGQFGQTGGGGASQGGGGGSGSGGGGTTSGISGGSALQGGTGGSGIQSPCENAAGGGGGGGGWFGGGGGAGGNDGNGSTCEGTRSSAAGGGGSGYINNSFVSSGSTSAFTDADDPNRYGGGSNGSACIVIKA